MRRMDESYYIVTEISNLYSNTYFVLTHVDNGKFGRFKLLRVE
jgi:hypothetical protein